MTGIAEPGNIEDYVRNAWGDANSCMSPNDRAVAVVADVNVALQNEGVPAVDWRFNSAHGTGAVFAFQEWVMELGETPYSMDVADNATPEQQAWQISAVYHEARHAEQWFRMARERIGLGATADQAAQVMQIPVWVARMGRPGSDQPVRRVAVRGRGVVPQRVRRGCRAPQRDPG